MKIYPLEALRDDIEARTRGVLREAKKDVGIPHPAKDKYPISFSLRTKDIYKPFLTGTSNVCISLRMALQTKSIAGQTLALENLKAYIKDTFQSYNRVRVEYLLSSFNRISDCYQECFVKVCFVAKMEIPFDYSLKWSIE